MAVGGAVAGDGGKVQQTIQIEGVPLHVIDTAGLRDSDDEVEKIGIARAWDAIAEADAVLFLHDLTLSNTTEYIAADEDIARAMAKKLPEHVAVINIYNKADVVQVGGAPEGLLLSAKTGAGLDPLRHKLLEIAGWQPSSEGLFIARARHVQALTQTHKHLDAAQVWLSAQGQSLDLLAEELRLAQHALGEITGEFTSDDLLGVIFSRFCIGK